MNKIVVGHFEADGTGDVYLPLGFVPDYFYMVDSDATNITQHVWFERMEDDNASAEQEGWTIANGGATTCMADDAGIKAYDSGTAIPTISDWAASTAFTARTATAHGTYVRPTTSSTTDRSAVFECVDSGTTGSTEPTWPKDIGGQVTDSDGIWERANVETLRGGYKGVVIADNITTDSQECYFLALMADESHDFGDVDGWTDGVQGA